MAKLLKPMIPLAAAALVLTACEGYENTAGGAAIGAAVGAVGGQLLGGKDARGAGAVLGAVVGGGLGARLDQQERELQEQIGDSGAIIQNTGSSLVVTLPEAITFDTDSTVVRPSLQNTLVQLAQNMRQYPNSVVQVVGHTDNVGDPAYNQGLSERRANAVANILINNGVPFNQIQTSGRGLFSPIASNATPQGRAQNRRVEVVIIPTNAT